jgi:DNA replication licensing factor MCM2
MLKKYMIYARRFVKPKLNEIDIEKVTNFYKDIRKESLAVGGIPIAVRHIESVLRMSEAHAKMHLRDYVRSDDIDFAIEMMLESFLQSQKISVARTLSGRLEKYKMHKTDENQLFYHILKKEADKRALFQKFTKGIEETGKIHVEIAKHVFLDEVRDYN